MSGAYTHGSGPTERDTTMRDLLAVVFKRKWLILSIVLITTASVGYKTARSPVTFSAEATLLLNRQGMRPSQLERRGSTLPWVEVVESEQEVVRSVPVLQAAILKLQGSADGFPDGIQMNFRQLAGRVRAGVIGESNVLYVGASAGTPQAAVRIANAVAEAYLEHHAELFQVPDAGPFMLAEADSTLRALEAMQGERTELLGAFGLTAIDEEEVQLVFQRSQLRLELGRKRTAQSALETEIEDGQAYMASNLAVGVPFSEHAGSTSAMALARSADELRERRSQLADRRAKYTEAHPEVVELRQLVEHSEAEVRSAMQQMVASKEHELRVVKGQEREIFEQIEEIDKKLTALPHIRGRLKILDARSEAAAEQYDRLTEQAMSAQVNRASSSDYGVRLLSPALNARKNQRGDLVRLALGPILALMAGLGLAFYLENLDHSLQNRDDIERHLEIPVLASFPDVDLKREGVVRQTGRLPFKKEREGPA